mgnify:CR=1 FL=1
MPTGYSKITGQNPFKGKKRPPFSDEHRRKIGEASKGRPSWRKGKKLKPRSEETRRKMSEAQKGRKHWAWKGGKPKCKDCGKRVSEYKRIRCLKCSIKHKIGKNAPNWKDGITSDYIKIRGCEKYKLWRESVFKRDGYTCMWCKDSRGGNLNADHIISFASILEKLRFQYGIENLFDNAMKCELLWDINNGRTLCEDCHIKTDTYGGKSK